MAKVWEWRMARELSTHRVSDKEGTCLCWHPTVESIFISGSYDGDLKFWKAGEEDGVEVVRMPSATEIEAADRAAAQILKCACPFDHRVDGFEPSFMAGRAACPVKVNTDRLGFGHVLQRGDEPAEGVEVVTVPPKFNFLGIA